MKTNELRLGNLVYDSVSKKNVEVDLDVLAAIVNDVSEGWYKPIEITQDLLEQYDLTKVTSSENTFYYIKMGELFLDWNSTGNCGAVIDELECPECCNKIDDIDVIEKIKYFHEFQNAYFVLSGGKELQKRLEPDGCQKECTPLCEKCEYRDFEKVPHPGGHHTASTEKYHCELGHWEDEF